MCLACFQADLALLLVPEVCCVGSLDHRVFHSYEDVRGLFGSIFGTFDIPSTAITSLAADSTIARLSMSAAFASNSTADIPSQADQRIQVVFGDRDEDIPGSSTVCAIGSCASTISASDYNPECVNG
jgi:hypothetical protein